MSEYTEVITKLYIGYFNRVPDPDGLQYWVEQMETGLFSSEQLAESLAQSQEALALYPHLNDPANDDYAGFIDSIYINAYGRPADSADLAYWQAELKSGVASSSLVCQLILRGDNDVSADSQTLANRVKVSESMQELFADKWTVEVGEFGRQLLAEVTAEQTSIDQAIYQLLSFMHQNKQSQDIEEDAPSAMPLTETMPSEPGQELGNYSGKDQTIVVIDSAWSDYWDSGSLLYSWDFADNDGDVRSSNPDGHGAWVTQLVVDLAPDAQVIRLKVFSDHIGTASMDALDQAFDWVLENVERYSIDVVNISLGSGNTEDYINTQFSDEYADLAEAGVMTTVAAGNGGETFSSGISLLAADPNVIAVSASDGEGQFEAWSQRHPELTDLVADGVWQLTDLTGFTVKAEGTSFSAPTVAATILLAQEAALDLRGEELTQAEFLSIARMAGDRVDPGGYTELNTSSFMDYLVDYLSEGDTLTPDQTGYAGLPPQIFDAMYGEQGGDWHHGWSDDQLIGTGENEYFAFNYGDDRLTGGGGSDVFQFNSATGHDKVSDFNPDNDFLDLGEYAYDQETRLVEHDDHTLISLAGGLSTIQLQGVTSADWHNLRDITAGELMLMAGSDSDESLLQLDNGEQHQPLLAYDLI